VPAKDNTIAAVRMAETIFLNVISNVLLKIYLPGYYNPHMRIM